VFQSADELSALAELCGQSVTEKALDRMIAIVRSRLSALPEKSWYARWLDEKDDYFTGFATSKGRTTAHEKPED
jgi:hypothetical protein